MTAPARDHIHAAPGSIVEDQHRHAPRVLRLLGEFDMSNAAVLDNALAESRQGEVVVLDLTDATFMDSQCIGVLAVAHRNGLDIRLRAVTGPVRRALELSGMDEILRMDD